MPRLLPFFIGLPFAIVSLLPSLNPSRAEMPPVAASQQDLQHRLDALGQRFQGGSLARWSNPDDQKVLKDMWHPSLLGRAPYEAEDVSSLVTMLKAQSSVLRLYTTAGHAVPGSEKAMRVRTKYQDEIVRSSAFLVSTSAALLQAIGHFAAQLKPEQLNAERRHSIEEGRSGVRSLIESFNDELKLPDVTTSNKAVLLDALAKNAETIAAYSPEEDRERYARAAGAVLNRLSTVEKTKLETFIAAMRTKECKGLCAIKG